MQQVALLFGSERAKPPVVALRFRMRNEFGEALEQKVGAQISLGGGQALNATADARPF